MNEYYHKFYSTELEQDFELLTFGHSGMPLILFPTSLGRYYDNKDNGLIQALGGEIESGKIKVYCPDGLDHEIWYDEEKTCGEKLNRYLQYERTIIKDVINFSLYETGVPRVALAGCSLGAYYACNIAFKQQQLVEQVYLLSGTFDVGEFLDDFYNDDVYFNSPLHFLPNSSDPWKYNHMKIVIGAGGKDFALDESKALSGILSGKGVEHKLEIWNDADHHWYWWNQMLPSFIRM